MLNKSFATKIIFLLSFSCLMMLAVIEINLNLNFAKKIEFKKSSFRTEDDENQLKVLLKVFFTMDVFLVDNDRLKETSLYTNSSFLEINFQKFIYNKDQQPNDFYTSFGLAYENVDAMPQMLATLYKQNDIKCFMHKHYADAKNNTQFLTLVLLDCNNNKYKIAINVFYKRGDFVYIGASSTQNISYVKWYNDVPRALQRFDLVTLKDSYANEIKIPADLRRYFYDYGHSKFIECNSALVEYNFKQSNGTYFQNETKNEQIKPCFIRLTRQLEKLYKHYYLTSGSLLGWFRDCGIVPHTTDMDLTLWSHEYDNSIKEALLGNPAVYLSNTMGRVRHSLEIRTVGCDFQYDLFFMYKITEKKQCTYFHSSFMVFPSCFPVFKDLCSGELLNSKFIVPCEPASLLDQLYSYKKWETPKLSKYEMNSMLWGHGMNRSLTDLPYMHRYYAKNGSLIVNETLHRINQEYYPLTGKNLTELPPDENEYL